MRTLNGKHPEIHQPTKMHEKSVAGNIGTGKITVQNAEKHPKPLLQKHTPLPPEIQRSRHLPRRHQIIKGYEKNPHHHQTGHQRPLPPGNHSKGGRHIQMLETTHQRLHRKTINHGLLHQGRRLPESSSPPTQPGLRPENPGQMGGDNRILPGQTQKMVPKNENIRTGIHLTIRRC